MRTRLNRPRAATALALSLALLPTSALSAPEDPEIPFEALGKAFLERHCPEDASARACALDDVLAASYVHLRGGAFDMFFPAAFFGDSRKGEIQDSALALLELQDLWVERHCRDEATATRARAELATLAAWVDVWNKSALGKVARADLSKTSDLYDLLGADDEVRAVAESLAPRLFDAETMALVPQFTERLRVVFSPTRRDFMEFVGYSGLSSPELRKLLWNPGVDQWTQYWADSTMIAALQYAPWHEDPKFKDGLSLNKFDKQGLRQHVTQQGATCLVATSLNRTDLPVIEKGLAVELTVAICGKANTIDGEGAISSTGASTAPYSRFVPGGNPNGGWLPPIPAAPFNSVLESRWRRGGGDGFYATPLREGQKLGAKRAKKERESDLAKNPLPHFELQDGSGKKLVVTAPFLGSLAEANPYPEGGFLNDYREFYRSYQACFLAWLREHGAEGDQALTRFNEFLALLCGDPQKSMEDAAAEVYGEPLTTADGSAGLEWRFLTWLADQ